jgi:hypothetical protein
MPGPRRRCRFVPGLGPAFALGPRLLLAAVPATIAFTSGARDPAGHDYWNAIGGRSDLTVTSAAEVSTIDVTLDAAIDPGATFTVTTGYSDRLDAGTYEFTVDAVPDGFPIHWFWDERAGDREVGVAVHYAEPGRLL